MKDKENVVYMQNGVLFRHKEQNNAICWKIERTGDHNTKMK
jgi:hypothetical protein